METCPLMIYYRCFPPHKSWFRIIVLLYTEEIRRTRCYNLNVGCHYDIPNRAKWKTPSESLLSIGMLVMSKGPMHIAPSIRPKFSADGFEQIRRLAHQWWSQKFIFFYIPPRLHWKAIAHHPSSSIFISFARHSIRKSMPQVRRHQNARSLKGHAKHS